MRKLLESMGLEAGPDLDEWMALATAVHEQRRKNTGLQTDRITRRSALYACAQLNSSVWSLLENAGMDWKRYVSAIGAHGTLSTDSPPEDVPIHETLEGAIRRAAPEFSDVRPIGAAAIAFFILKDAAANPEIADVPRWLEQLGLDVERGADALYRSLLKSAESPSSATATRASQTKVDIGPGDSSAQSVQPSGVDIGYWIHRTSAGQRWLYDGAQPGQTRTWPVDEGVVVNPGDVVWFWQRGDASVRGLYGRGTVQEQTDRGVLVALEAGYDPFIPAVLAGGFGVKLDNLEQQPERAFLAVHEGISKQLEIVVAGFGPDSGVDISSFDPQSVGAQARGVEIPVSELETHVATALLWAQQNDPGFSENGYISAGAALQGAIVTKTTSRAFARWREVLSDYDVDLPEADFAESPGEESFTISPALNTALQVINGALPHLTNVWGRELITACLYASELVYPDFDSASVLDSDWRKSLQDVWARFLYGDKDGPLWQAAIHGLAHDYKRLEEAYPEYATDQRRSMVLPESEPPLRPTAWVDSDAIQAIRSGDLTRHHERDSLSAKDQAELFATLLVAKEVTPPFAIGLLGDWGVGKTFFMRLMQEKVASMAGKNAQVESSADSVSRAAQIEFNAWHYVDSDLWASLASHIFDELAFELRGAGDTVDSVRRELRKKIQSSEREQNEARAVIAEAQVARKAAAQELTTQQALRDELRKDYDDRRLARLWDAVMRVKPGDDPETEHWPDLDQARKDVEKAAKDLGLAEVIDTAEAAQCAYEQFNDLRKRGAALSSAIAAAFTGGRVWASVGVLIVLLAAVIVGWDLILGLVSKAVGDIRPYLAPVLQFASVAGAGIAWASRQLKKVSSSLGFLEAIRAEMKNPRIEPIPAGEEETRAHERMRDLDAQIATEEHRLQEADRQIAEAQAEIQRINSGGLVYDFLEGRVRDSRYLDRLGLISVIRRDFEQLADLLSDWRTHGRDGAAGSGENGARQWDTRPIERIVLYIDDLDRCPPERVVEVLQAVHLLLAFELFVVVVAVDARWLERSLNEAYNARPPTIGDRPQQDRQHRFSAQNYLEKIFQIPFSIPVMDDDGYEKLVENMTDTPLRRFERSIAGTAETETGAATQSDSIADQDGQGTDDTGEVAGGATTGTSDGDSVAEAETESSQDQDAEQQLPAKKVDLDAEAAKAAERQQQEQEAARERIAAMLLEDWEKAFIAALYPFISTPRIAKRFFNIYRLLRVTAAKDDAVFARFIDRDNGEYRVVLLLLAISVGRAETGPQILTDISISHRRARSLRSWLKLAAETYKEELAELAAARSAKISEAGAAGPPSEREEQLEKLAAAASEIGGSVADVAKRLRASHGPSLEDDLSLCRDWSCEVGRYSFGWHLAAQE